MQHVFSQCIALVIRQNRGIVVISKTCKFVLLAAVIGSTPAYAKKKPQPVPVAAPVVVRNYTPIDRFYSARKDALLWMSNREAQAALIQLLRDAPIDGFARGPVLATQIEAAIAAAQTGNAAAASSADRLMSQSLIDYVQSLYAPVPGMTYGDNWVRPRAPSGESILAKAAHAPSLAAHMNEVWNLNPVYAQLRKAAIEEAKLPNGGQSARLDVRKWRSGRFDEGCRRQKSNRRKERRQPTDANARGRHVLRHLQPLLARAGSPRPPQYRSGGRKARTECAQGQ